MLQGHTGIEAGRSEQVSPKSLFLDFPGFHRKGSEPGFYQHIYENFYLDNMSFIAFSFGMRFQTLIEVTSSVDFLQSPARSALEA